MPHTPTVKPPGAVSNGDQASADEIAAFLETARRLPKRADGRRGRLLFALDATMSRQPTWDRACELQAEMFDETARSGGLDVSLIYFRGFGECRASRWVADARALRDIMTGIECRGGQTQIRKVLAHALAEARREKLDALVYVGDAMEEDIDSLSARAGELGLLGVKAFLFQEGSNPAAEQAFREIARLTGGAYVRFDAAAARELAALLRAVAAYAAGGLAALQDLSARGGEGARRLLPHLKTASAASGRAP